MNHNVVRLQLEGLFSNPGLRLEQIMVCNDEVQLLGPILFYY